jgi:hypothetical protein
MGEVRDFRRGTSCPGRLVPVSRFAVRLGGVKGKRTVVDAVAFVRVPVKDKATGQDVDHIVFLSDENRPVAGFAVSRFDGAEVMEQVEVKVKVEKLPFVNPSSVRRSAGGGKGKGRENLLRPLVTGSSSVGPQASSPKPRASRTGRKRVTVVPPRLPRRKETL